MRKNTIAIILIVLCALPVHADILGDAMKGMKLPAGLTGGTGTTNSIDNQTVASGLKEALTIGTANAVSTVSGVDGYFANQAIKILLPDKIRQAAEMLRKIGYEKQVDDFVLSMNRAAEKAAPRAKAHFVEAIREMTFEDARKILGDGDTAVTDYFRGKTQKKLYDEFRPTVSASMDEVGVTRSYKNMVGKYAALPLVGGKAESVDLDHHVTTKALDGLFLVLGQEEKKIRTDPAARVTDLLKDVFGRK